MPYSNPTWWDVASPTLANLTRAELLAATALNASLEPIYETYDDKPTPRSGVVMCPWSPFVRERLVRSLQSLSWNASGSPRRSEITPRYAGISVVRTVRLAPSPCRNS